MLTPEQIAKGLSKAQREALVTLTVHMTIPNNPTVSSNAYKSLNDAWGGILVGSDWRLNAGPGPSHRKAYRLTPLGLAVRAELERQKP
jgi:hypothetical protein